MVNLTEAILNAQQRRQRGLVMRRYHAKIEMARERLSHRAASGERLTARARHHAIQLVRNRVAGERGRNYVNLSASEKMRIDKRVQRSKGVIARIALRLIPSLRKADLEKFSHKPSVHEDVNALFETLGDYSLVKTKEKKFTSANPDGKYVHEIHHNGDKIGTIEPYSSYREKRKPGAMVITSRTDVTKYSVHFHPGKGPTKSSDIPMWVKMGHHSPKEAIESASKHHAEWSSSVKESVDVNALFEAKFELGVEDPSLSKDPKKRFHQLIGKDGKVKLDGRFKIWRKKAQIKNTGIDESTIHDLVDMVYEEIDLNESENYYIKADRDRKRKSSPGEYHVTDHNNKKTHKEPFKTSDQAIHHADKLETETGRIHIVHHINNGKIQKQWQYSDSQGKFAQYSDHRGQIPTFNESKVLEDGTDEQVKAFKKMTPGETSDINEAFEKLFS